MPSEPLPNSPLPQEGVGSVDTGEIASDSKAAAGAVPVDLSEFSQRLASFGLGETPDPLLTEARPPSKRRPRD
jgi:hypothetical protein